MGNGASAPGGVRAASPSGRRSDAQAIPREDAKTRRQLRSKEAEAETRVCTAIPSSLTLQDAEISFIAGQVGVHSMPDRDRVKCAGIFYARLTA